VKTNKISIFKALVHLIIFKNLFPTSQEHT